MSNEVNVISVVLERTGTPTDVPEEATLGIRDLMHRLTSPIEISVDALCASLGKLTGNLSALLADLQAVGGFELAEVRVAVELTAEGRGKLIGNLTAGAKGAIQLTCQPPAKSDV